MKTLVAPAHEPGPHPNGYDGCHARIGSEGCCPGVKIAKWLNGLGNDDDQYIKWPSGKVRATNGDVRQNYLRGNFHVVALDPALARASAEVRRLSAELRHAKRRLKLLQNHRHFNGAAR